MIRVKEKVSQALFKAIALKGLSQKQIESWLEIPPDKSLGDLAFPCFRLSQQLKKGPQQIALDLKEKIEKKKPKEIERIEVAGPYLNFFFQTELLAEKTVKEILKLKEKYGFNASGKKQRVMVEFSQPNTNKPQHVGHVRNNVIGEAVANLLKANGFKALKVNLINDRGIHICKSMLAYKKWGENRTPESEKIKGDHFVGNYYVMFNKKVRERPELEAEALELLRKWEQGDKETIALWKKMNQWVLAGFNQTYKEMGVSFDEVFVESDLYKGGKKIIEEARKKGLLGEKEGAIVAELERYGLPDKVLLRKDGTALYITQDIYLAKKKFDQFKLARSIYVVGSEQNLYFKQLFKILELLGFKWAKNCHHLSYGMVYLPSGKMKSREGTVIDADDLIKDVEGLAVKELKERYPELKEKELKKRAKAIALAAIKFFMLKVDVVKDILFKPEESVSFEGETGPYIQYAYARAKSILRKAKAKTFKADFKLLKTAKEKALINLLAKYPEIILDCSKQLSLHKLCHYLIDLSSEFNSFYHELPVLKAGKGLREARLSLVKAFSQVAFNGLSILGIQPLEEM